MHRCTLSGARAAAAISALLLAGIPSANAGVTYTNSATYTSALLPGSYTEAYGSFAFGGLATPSNFQGGAANAFKYTASTPAQAFLVFDLAGNNYLTTSGQPTTQWSAPITINFTGAPVFAIGGSFFMTSAGGQVVGGNLTVSLSDGSSFVLSNQSNSSFWGYISTTALTSMTLTPDATHHFMSMDNFNVGTSNVPTPGAGLVLAIGGIAAARRRRAVR